MTVKMVTEMGYVTQNFQFAGMKLKKSSSYLFFFFFYKSCIKSFSLPLHFVDNLSFIEKKKRKKNENLYLINIMKDWHDSPPSLNK